MQVAIDAITVGERRREDLGDMDALARSIERYGLIQPVVIDGNGRLVAGGRRLAACRQLGWSAIETRAYGQLTDAELRELELEENLRRKDLTEAERSRIMVGRAAVAAEIAQQQALADTAISANDSQKRPRGRPRQPAAPQAVADRIGVNRQTLRNAQAHVAALEAFPELDQPAVGQQEAIETAKVIRSLPDEKQARAREVIREQRRQEQAKSQELLAKAGILDHPDVLRAELRAAFTKAVKHSHSELLMLDVDAVVEALKPEDDAFTRRFIADARAWLDGLDQRLARGIRLVGREG